MANKKKLAKVNGHIVNFQGSATYYIPSKNPEYASFVGTSAKVAKLLTPKRQQAINNIDELRKHRKVAENWCHYTWRKKQESLQPDDKPGDLKTTASPTTFYVPQSRLTKNGDISEVIAKQTLDKLSDTFNLEDDQPFMIGNSLIQKLITAPKTVVAETYINGIGKHERPCFVIRKLLSCKIDGNTYMLVADEKYYQNSPTVAMPLTLLVGGEPHGIAQLARIDSIGHLGEDAAAQLGIQLKNPTLVPDYLKEKFESTHHNAVAHHKKKGKTSKFQAVKKIAGTHHIHMRDENFELMYALCHMATNCLQVYRNTPAKFLRFNAKEVSEGDIYIDDYKHINEHSTSMHYQLKLMALLNELKSNDIIGNSSVINTETLQQFFARTFNITNFENDNNLTQFLDEMRTFKPTELVKLVDPAKIVGPRQYLKLPGKAHKQFIKMLNRIIDYDYIKAHQDEYATFLSKYREMYANNPNSSENDGPLTIPSTGGSTVGPTTVPTTGSTPPSGYGDRSGKK